MKARTYFIAYVHQTDAANLGFGNSTATIPGKLNAAVMDKLKEEMQKKFGYKTVLIVSMIQLEE